MELSTSDLQRIANLARIELTDAEMPPLREKLSAIFKMIDDLLSVNTDGVEPMAHAQPVTLPLREDKVAEPTDIETRDRYQKGAPAVEDGLFTVPKVIE
jgi:aspartyl-tRNA(Asn)/glutamyl-tRNA(Gln) amidotransferase subunit C